MVIVPRLFGVWVEILLLLAFFRQNLSPTYRTEFYQIRKYPMQEIQLFPNLGHNLCENDKETLHDYI